LIGNQTINKGKKHEQMQVAEVAAREREREKLPWVAADAAVRERSEALT
jgi:hypothetical protein